MSTDGGVTVLRLRSPLTVRSATSVPVEVLAITAAPASNTAGVSADESARRAFVLHVPPHRVLSLPLPYASLASALSVRSVYRRSC